MRSITIGILNLNQPDLTVAVLEKLAAIPEQEWNCQVLLWDNGSDAVHLEPLEHWVDENASRFQSLALTASRENLGVAGGRNELLKRAENSRVLFLDNDLELPDTFQWLAQLWQLLDTDDSIAIVSPLLVFAAKPYIVQAAGLGFTEQARVGYLERGKDIETIPKEPIEVIASPAACWLLRKEAAEDVGLFSEDYYPAQFEDVDFCVQLHLRGWKALCDRSIAIKHIENATTRNIENNSFARTTVKHAMKFKAKFADTLPRIANLKDDDIDWGPIEETRPKA